MFHKSLRRLSLLGLILGCLTLASNVVAQSTGQPPKTREASLLEDFVHYVLVARPELAYSAAQALVESEISDADLYMLVDESGIGKRLDDALVRAARIAELESVAGSLQVRLNKGRIDLARDPDEIARHIQNLIGTPRGRLMAEEALRAAGEYAVPQLLDILTGANSAELNARCTQVLLNIGRQAVAPLSVALPRVDAVTQERLCDILGQINYIHAVPALGTLMADAKTTPTVRTAARRAADRLGAVIDTPPAEMWNALAELYWGESESLIAWPTEVSNNIWFYKPGSGLYAVPVPTGIFSEVMAMQCSENALRLSSDSLDALSMWIAANFRRSDELGDGVDPTYGPDRQIGRAHV